MYIGLMSGTSLDGVDGVLAHIPDHYSGGGIMIDASAHVPFDAEFRAALLALQVPGNDEMAREFSASKQLVHAYAEVVRQLLTSANISSSKVKAIGVHGQTVRHQPDIGFSRQINQPALLAELTGIDVVADFRSRDLAAGGQGAPLVPAFHQAMFSRDDETRVLVNVGGISNVSILHANGNVLGFDTGPGNVMMDAWIGRHLGFNYDEDGSWAKSGRVIPELLSALLQEPFFSMLPPKSTGRDLFGMAWLNAHLRSFAHAKSWLTQDVQATLAQLTAVSIADAVMQHAPQAKALYACGGGAFNRHLLQRITAIFSERYFSCVLETTASLGVSPAHVESLAFAWLAQRFCLRQPSNLPVVTGAKALRILGCLYPA